ncbi:facilitated trehalose transporter Tret1-like isoform X1 [Planococcus citri]|uniref:facilitated trehalose transporter Tret1-like isoform X1 n=3 Tax=Planococcus citri TaxID=170843 RepID=UPI0031F8378B
MIEKEQTFIPREINSAFKRQAWYTSIAYTTYFLFGVMRGFPAFALEQMKSNESIVVVQSEDSLSWIASLSIFSNPIGSILAGIIMDKFGRKITLQLSLFTFTVGWTFITFSQTIWMLYAGNVIVGLAIGMGACSTIYVAEICEIRNRAMMLSFLEIYYSSGIVMAFLLTCYMKWNVAALIFTMISALSLFLLYYIPESPYWLMKMNRVTEALESYNKLNNKQIATEFESEFNDILLSLDGVKQETGLRVLRNNFKAFAIMVTFHVLLQGCGYNITLAYVNDFIPASHGKLIAILYSFSSFLSSFVTPLTANYLRRRESTMVSGVGMAFALFLLMVHKTFADSVTFEYFWFLVPIALSLFMFCCTIGVLTLSQAMIGELFPTEVRGMMCGITEAIGTILSALSVKLYPTIRGDYHQNMFLTFFASFGILTALFGKFILPETHGKSLNEIQEQYFRRNSNVVDYKKASKTKIERQI